MNKLFDRDALRGRTAIVTGACGNLGKVISEGLLSSGASVVLVDHPRTTIADLAKDFSEIYGKDACEAFSVDLEIEVDRAQFINKIISNKKELHILINNAAINADSNLEGWSEPFPTQSLVSWRRAFEVNVTAPFHLCQGLYPLMQNTKGSIINITSIYADSGPNWRLYDGTLMANQAAYSTSKAALSQLTRWLSTSLSPEVRVNSVSPGGIFRNQPRQFVERYVAATPLNRMANETDIVGAILYLASDASSYVTGQTLHVNGGWDVW